MWPSKLICLFMIYSLIGWIYESTYCAVKSGRWENRGFLYGPACPIYGVGAVLISLIEYAWARSGQPGPFPWQIFVIAFFGSMVLEFVTSWVLEKLFHAVWWDYSRVPLNIKGRTSVPTSIGFGLAGLLVVYVLTPNISQPVIALPQIAAECLALVLLSIFMVDLTLTISALTNFASIVASAENRFNDTMDTVVETVQTQTDLVVGTVQQKAGDAMDRIHEEGRAIADNVLAMNEMRRSALRRVRAFRFPKIEVDSIGPLAKAMRRDRQDKANGRA